MKKLALITCLSYLTIQPLYAAHARPNTQKNTASTSTISETVTDTLLLAGATLVPLVISCYDFDGYGTYDGTIRGYNNEAREHIACTMAAACWGLFGTKKAFKYNYRKIGWTCAALPASVIAYAAYTLYQRMFI